jgi:hypothetical protein
MLRGFQRQSSFFRPENGPRDNLKGTHRTHRTDRTHENRLRSCPAIGLRQPPRMSLRASHRPARQSRPLSNSPPVPDFADFYMDNRP